MPISFLRRLTGKVRTVDANRQLGLSLAFVAGAANAGGFLAVNQYTSHMTGIVSAMTDDLALGNVALALAGLGALLSFIAGPAPDLGTRTIPSFDPFLRFRCGAKIRAQG